VRTFSRIRLRFSAAYKSQETHVEEMNEHKNGSWNALIPSTAAEAVALRANGILTNWVSVAKTVRADPEPVEGSKHGRVFITSTAVFKVNHIDRKMFESKHE